jgi:Rrf2 family protein
VHLSAKADYALRAVAEIAGRERDWPVAAEAIADAQQMPVRFLLGILADLRRAGIVRSQRGQSGGWLLAHPAAELSLAAVIRAVDGPLASVQGVRPEGYPYAGHAAPLQQVWIAVRSSLREVLEQVTVADVAAGRLPAAVLDRAADTEAWQPH